MKTTRLWGLLLVAVLVLQSCCWPPLHRGGGGHGHGHGHRHHSAINPAEQPAAYKTIENRSSFANLA